MSGDRLPELFEEASPLDPAGRRRLLDRLRRESPALADELARLLAEPEAKPSPIDVPAIARQLGTGDELPPPERVGPYRLVREIGRGGMGRVFLAAQETPDFSRAVALKLIDRPGPYADAVRRFRDEVRILASLEHPWIARFLDGGKSAEGIWFLALEYVEGEDLITHAVRHGLDPEARVRLLVAVADAVAYAHGRGVVHRDLKPGNILVGRDGWPRLLDFGISKLLDPSGQGEATETAQGSRLLTPAYASPEQLAGGVVTPATDVYSLGVILYELIAGHRPRTDPTDAPGGAPEPPSTAGRRRSRTTGDPSSPVPPGTRLLPRRRARDLDAICLRALRRVPEERYADASHLAADLRSFLEGKPVTARGRRATGLFGGARARRWLAAALLAVPLLGLAALGLWSRWHADSGGAEAPAAAMAPGLFPLDPVNPPPVEQSERRFAEAPTDLVAGAELAIRLARDQRLDEARIVVARLRQVPGAELDPLVDYADANVAIYAGEDQRAQVFLARARDNAIAQARWDLLGTIRFTLGSTLKRLGYRDAGQQELVEARALLVRAGDHRPLYRTLINLASSHYERGEVERCAALYEEALGVARRGGLEPLIALINLAEIHLLRGRPDLAEAAAREPLPQFRGHPNPARAADALTLLATIVRELGRTEEARSYLAEAIALVEGADQPGALANALFARSRIDLEQGRIESLEPVVRQLEQLAVADVSRRPLAMAHSIAGERAALAGDFDRARAAFSEARRLFLAEGFRDFAAFSDLAAAELEVRAGDPTAAVEIITAALASFDEASAIAPRFFAELLLARIDAAAGRLSEAKLRLAALGTDNERSPSRRRAVAYLAARGAVGAVEGRQADARRDLDAALALAVEDGRKPAELELRLELATQEGAGGAAPAIERVRQEAESLGLEAIARRARQLLEHRR